MISRLFCYSNLNYDWIAQHTDIKKKYYLQSYFVFYESHIIQCVQAMISLLHREEKKIEETFCSREQINNETELQSS